MRLHTILLLSLIPLWSMARSGTNDSLQHSASSIFRSSQREVRNYIRPCLYFNYFGTRSTPIDHKNDFPTNLLTNRLGQYRFAQSNIGFYCPLYTHTHFAGADSSDVNTFHFLMTMNGLTDMPEFSNLDKQHKLYKIGLGLRAIYSFRSQFILFTDLSPYVVGDKFDKQSTQQLRLAGSVVFNWMINPSWSVRAGVTRTFLWGNRWVLPMVGIRIGKLDGKFYFSAQFPRYTSFVFQPSPKFSITLYSRAYGGVYNISNGDSIYFGSDTVIQFGQTGLANGLRFEYRASPDFSFFVSPGFAVQNHIWLYSHSFNDTVHVFNRFAPFYKGRPENSVYLQFGVTWRFGKAKRSTGNYLMYDVFDMNNGMDPGDNNSGPGNSDIPAQYSKKQMQDVQYKDVADLVDDTDLY
ncbi:MAG TPA: DUF6268 family outer membrane beta-barrel protein [Bacteroidia bacterium]|nr:DUF6268 family outer membrane beta-barrel protein [Bacteroidia bacterium]